MTGCSRSKPGCRNGQKSARTGHSTRFYFEIWGRLQSRGATTSECRDALWFSASKISVSWVATGPARSKRSKPASIGSPGWCSFHSHAHTSQSATLERRSSNFCSMRLHALRSPKRRWENRVRSRMRRNQKAGRARRLLSSIGEPSAVKSRPYGWDGACRYEWQTGDNSKKSTAEHHCQ